MTTEKHIVLTLDAGGTNFWFSAIQNGQTIGKKIHFPAQASSIEDLLNRIAHGFDLLYQQHKENVVAISFAFPGPADYTNGIIGDLENLPLFKGGVALGPFLSERFKLPVFINNDGDLFALGEAIYGFLPQINKELLLSGNPKQYKNLLGVTFGTGFGAGIVSNKQLFLGDNSAQAEINRMRNPYFENTSIEDSTSIRAIKREYALQADIAFEQSPEPFTIFKIAKGQEEGNKKAALHAFETLGKAAGSALADAVTLVDGMVVIGGGLSGAAELFMPHLVNEMNRAFVNLKGSKLNRMEVQAFDLTNAQEKASFLEANIQTINIPGSKKTIEYQRNKKMGVGINSLGTSQAVALGAYAFALQQLEIKK